MRRHAPAADRLDTLSRCLRCQRRLPPTDECPEHGRLTAISDVPEPERPPPALAPPGWTLGSALASGGTAVVYEVQRTAAAPAVMKLARWSENEIRARFSLEAEVLRSVGAPTTPTFIEHGVLAEHPYIVMEHVPGETLAAWMARNGERGGLGEIMAILTRIAGALAGLHAAKYVHRDLKPENILIGGKGIRLLDFGLVKPMRSSAVSLTQVGSIVGTPHYLSPEAIKPGRVVDHSTDIYALGVIAFEMLTGRPPFTGERRAIEYHHLVVRPPSVCEFRSVPQVLDDLVLSCLAKQPESRPENAEALRNALSIALNSIGTMRGVVATTEPKRDSRPLGTNSPVALVWIEHADPVIVSRTVVEVNGIVVRHRGAGILAAFPGQHDGPALGAALSVCSALTGERRRCAIHLTTALVRRSAQGKVTVYGAELEHPERWIPRVPFSGIVLTRAAAAVVVGGATQIDELPGFFRESQRDRTDAADARMDPPLVGREGLIRSLMSALASSRELLVGVSGSGGSGKSRVLRAMAERLQAIGREVVIVTGQRRFLGDRSDDDRLTAALGGGDDLADALASAAARGAIVAIDDLPRFSTWVQRLVLEPPAPLLRMFTSPEPMFEVAEGVVSRIVVDLPALSYADADVLLRSMLQPARLLPDALVERLAIRGTGNPGLLIGMARDIKRRGAVRRVLGGDWYVAVDELDTLLVPPGPSWFASRLLEDLPVELAPIVRIGSGLGPRFTAEEVVAATGARDVETRLDLLVHERLFSERNRWYEFEDATLQEAIYNHALDDRQLVHRRMLQYWLATEDRNVMGRLARLAYHAAGSGEGATAAACWTALARAALRANDPTYADAILARCQGCLGGPVPAQVRDAIAMVAPA